MGPLHTIDASIAAASTFHVDFLMMVPPGKQWFLNVTEKSSKCPNHA